MAVLSMKRIIILISVLSLAGCDSASGGGGGGGDNGAAPQDSWSRDTTGDVGADMGGLPMDNWTEDGTLIPGEDTEPGEDSIPGEDTVPGEDTWTPPGPGGLGGFCGTTPDCPAWISDPYTLETVFNPDWATCLHNQCESLLCLAAGAPGLYMNVPACTQPCMIYTDEIINETGQPGSDGIEENTVLTDCYGFEDGPGGAEWVCVNFADPTSPEAAYCVPGTNFKHCSSDADCPATEQCNVTTIGGQISDRCIARIQDGPQLDTAQMSESCDENAIDGPTYCESGWCFGLGCVSYCSDDLHCDTTKIFPDTGCDTGTGTCKGWPTMNCAQDSDCSYWECGGLDKQIFSEADYTADLCWPKTGCQRDADCPDGHYCQQNYEGAVDSQTGLPAWSNFCVPKNPFGDVAGAPCGDLMPPCENDSLCVDGHCSALCTGDDDCGANQLCTVYEFTVDTDGDSYADQALPIQWCTTYEGSKTECYSDAACGAGERCSVSEFANDIDDGYGSLIPNPDGPYTVKGYCVTADPLAADLGEPCLWGDDCKSGWCLYSDPDTGTEGWCSQVCADTADCTAIEVGGDIFNGICGGLLWSYGGDANVVETNIYLGLCFFTAGSADDCAGNFTCGAGEACSVYPVTYAPDYVPNMQYVCTNTQNADGSQPTLGLGQVCDPSAEDAEGNPLQQCLSGLCMEDAQAGTGYCSELCQPGGTCAFPTMDCLPITTIPRKGMYQANSATWHLCRKDIDCTPCMFSEFCPGDRVCVNLGQDDNTLSDYRCIQACNGDADCAGTPASTCNQGADAYGTPHWACFDKGTFPVNYCY